MELNRFLILILTTSELYKVFGDERIEEAPENRDIFEINKGLAGLVDGDVIKKSENTRNTIRDETLFWPGAVIPFKYSLGLSLEAIGSIELARQEYRLRTCLDLVEADDTTTNYISFQTLTGCWSYVGMISGAQTISIGSGCESMAIVCHEIMHAIGIWHEQSCADRDDYVQIMWDNIEKGYEHNFIKYDWETTDAKRVPYDYNSIMHYGDTEFSSTGEPTIITRDPAFQDIVGQRLTFSRGDSEKINKMYKCSDTLLVSYNCNYNDEAACGYMQEYDTDQLDWKRHEVGDKSIPISTAAPTEDATWGVSGKGSYMILDTSGKTTGDVGEMRSMRFVSRSEKQCFQFSYYIDRDESSPATIAAYLATINNTTGEIISYNDPVATFAKNSVKKWKVHRTTLNAPASYRIVFRGTTGGSSEDVLAIDDVSVQDKPCDDNYFVQQDYSTILNTYVIGKFFESPVMTSNLGYRFRIKVYPQGNSKSDTGYMSVYFGLVKGPDDNNLAWPFCNKYVRLMVVDQNDNPLYALNKFAEYLTSQNNGGDYWNQPEDPESPKGYWGYSNFMSISDLRNTHHYSKHDSLMISVLIQDMNWVNGDECNEGSSRSTKQSATGTHDNHTSYRDDGDKPAHDNNHEEMIPVGKAVGIAIGCAGFVLVVVTSVLYCVQKSHKQQMKHVVDGITLQPKIEVLGTYDEGKVSFDALPEKV